jgi:hypothetical protein
MKCLPGLWVVVCFQQAILEQDAPIDHYKPDVLRVAIQDQLIVQIPLACRGGEISRDQLQVSFPAGLDPADLLETEGTRPSFGSQMIDQGQASCGSRPLALWIRKAPRITSKKLSM